MELSVNELKDIIEQVVYQPTAGPKPVQQEAILRCLHENESNKCVLYKTIVQYLWDRKLVKKKGKETTTNFITRITVNLHEQVRDINKKIFNSEFRYRAHIVTKTAKGLALLTDKEKIIEIIKSLEKTGKVTYPKDMLEELIVSSHVEETPSKPLVWSEINLDNIAKNIRTVKNNIGRGKMILADMSNNALGLGIEKIAEVAVKKGVSAVGVDNIRDAIAIRKVNSQIPIILFGKALDILVPDIVKNNIIPSVSRLTEMERLSTAIGYSGKKLSICAEIGIFEKEALKFNYTKFSNLLPEWLLVQTPWGKRYNDYENKALSMVSEYNKLLKEIQTKPQFKYRCSIDINGLLKAPDFFNAVRVCPSLYGFGYLEDLQPVFVLKTVLGSVYKLPPTKYVLYGKERETKKPVTIGVLPIGFKHGYSSLLSHKAEVIIDNKPAMIVGKIGMDTITVDISHMPDVNAGEEVILIGRSNNEEITLREISQLSGISEYELLSLFNSNELIQKSYKSTTN